MARASGRSVVKPSYAGDGLVNLIASIEATFSSHHEEQLAYPVAHQLQPLELAERPKLALLLVDGLGYQFLQSHAAGSVLGEHLRAPLTSVFPSTTASAITSVITGTAPLQHAMTGWHMWFEELSMVAAPLPFRRRGDGAPMLAPQRDPGIIFDTSALFSRLDVDSFMVYPRGLVDTPYTRAHRGAATLIGYRSLRDGFDVVAGLLADAGPRVIYAYWPHFDALAHREGVGSAAAVKLFQQLDQNFARLLESAAGFDATVLVTADHGFIDTAPTRHIALDQYPDLVKMLEHPLTGEPRTAYCHVRDGARAEFADCVHGHLEHGCDVWESEQLIEQGFLGRGKAHPRLHSRIGDFVLMMKDNYIIYDRAAGETAGFSQVGVHGGTSSAEMQIPLVVGTC